MSNPRNYGPVIYVFRSPSKLPEINRKECEDKNNCENSNEMCTNNTNTDEGKLTKAWEAGSRRRARHVRHQARKRTGKQVHRQQADTPRELSSVLGPAEPLKCFPGARLGSHVTGFHFVPFAYSITVVFGGDLRALQSTKEDGFNT